MKRRSRLRQLKMPEISLTPLIDTALTLLVIFMIAAPMVQNSIRLNLPEGKSKEVSEQQEFVVSLNKEGIIYFNSYPVEKDKLIETVKEAIKEAANTPVFVRADETLSYGAVLHIVDDLKLAGVKSVGMTMRRATPS